MRLVSRPLIIGLLAIAALVSACGSTVSSSSAERAAEESSAGSIVPLQPSTSSASSSPEVSAPEVDDAETPVPEPWEGLADSLVETDQVTGESLRGMPSAQPFGVINNLPVAVKIDASDVDPYDFKVRDGFGRPDLRIPEGFAGVIKPGASTAAVFFPNYLASDAPFRLNVSAWTPANAEVATASQPIGSVSFDKIYFCLLQIIQSDCNILTSKEWYGWGYRVDNSKAVRNQVPQMCNTTRELGTYVFEKQTRKARVRLECASKKALVIGNAAIIEDVPN